MLSKSRRSGFTLIELLTVVAIIAILASLTFAVAPRVIERAKIARMTGALNNLRTSLTQYYSQHNSYPPAYGYRSFEARDLDPGTIFSLEAARDAFWLSSFMGALQLYTATDLYDEFAESYSTSQPPATSLRLLEFSPIGRTDQGRLVDEEVVLSDGRRMTESLLELYNGSNLPDQVSGQLEQSTRPFIYIPVNMAQFNRAKKYWATNDDWLASKWNPNSTEENANLLAGITFPPPTYDAYVLISVGPGGGTFGLLDPPPFIGDIAAEDVYHMLGLRAYFLATRDMNGNGVLDFHYEARARGDEAELQSADEPLSDDMTAYFTSLGITGEQATQILPNSLPDAERFNGYGPYIYVVN